MADEEPIVQPIEIDVKDTGTEAVEKLKKAVDDLAESLVRNADGSKKVVDVSKAMDEIVAKTGATYTQASEAIKKASEALASIKKPPPIVEEADVATVASYGTRLLALGAAFTGLVTVLGLAAKASFSFAESQSKIINALGDLSDKTNTSIKDISALETSFAHAGVSASEFASGYSKLADVVEKTWEKIKHDTQTGVDTLEQRSIAAARAAGALNKIEKERSEALNDKNTPNTQPVNPFQGDLVTAESAEKALQKELELRQARLAAREAERAENEARKNDIAQITKGVQGLIDGNGDALKSFNASADNILKGVVAAAGQGSDALAKLGENFAAVGSKAPEVKEVLAKLGAALQNIQDPALRTKVAFAALGPAALGFLSALDAGKLEEFTTGLDKVNNSLSEADKKISGEFKSALSGLAQDLDNIKNKLASAFEGAFVDSIKLLDDFFVRMSPHIRDLADAFASVLGPAVKLVTVAFVAVGEAGNLLIDVFKNINKIIVFIGTLGTFGDLKGGILGLIEVAEALFKIFKGIATLDFKEAKKGIDDLAAARRKDQDAKDKANEAKSNTEQKATTDEKGRTVLPESEIKKAEQEENRRRAAQGLPSLEPVDRSAKPQVNDQDSFASRFGDAAKRVGQGALDLPSSPPIQSFLETLKNILGTGTTSGKTEPGTDNSVLQPLLDSINSLGTKLPGKQDQPSSTLGIRGEVDDAATKTAGALEETISPLDQLKTAAAAAAEELNKVKNNDTASNDSGGDSSVTTVAAGGHIRGPGTSTSDSIPAMLSDGEFVVKKSAVDKIGVDTLMAINAERFADGGMVRRRRPDGKIEEITTGIDGRELLRTTYDSESDLPEKKAERAARNKNASYDQRERDEKAYNSPEAVAFRGTPNERALGLSPEALAIQARSLGVQGSSGDNSGSSSGEKEGAYHVSIDADPTVLESLNAASEAAGEADPNFVPIIYESKRKRHKDGGLIGDLANALNSFKLPRFADGGRVSLSPHLPRLAEGGRVSLSPRLPRFAYGGEVATSSNVDSAMQHFGTVDLSTNYGDVRVRADRSSLTDLKRASVMRNIGSSPKSSWVR